MASEAPKYWWEDLPPQVGGDMIVADIGAHAKNVQVGKHLTQQVYEIVGEPTPEDRDTIETSFEELSTAIADLHGKVDESTLQMAQFQAELLKGELTKTEQTEQPSASAITQVGDWFLENLPDIAETLTGLFATPAVGKVVGKAGQVAIDWVRARLGARGGD